MATATARLPPDYPLVLRGVGLTPSTIADLHDAAPPGDGQSLREALETELVDSPADSDELFAELTDTLAQSPCGIDAPGKYWNSAPSVHLSDALAPYGMAVDFEPVTGADHLIVVRDASGNTYRFPFTYPATPLGDDNYPALVAALEDAVLSAAGLSVVRLSSPENTWRFLVLKTEQLRALKNRYGESVTVFGSDLLSDGQPQAFTDEGSVPVPDWYGVDPEPTARREPLEPTASGDPASFWELEDDQLPDDTRNPLDELDDVEEPSVDVLLERFDEERYEQPSNSDVAGEAIEEEIEETLSDLSTPTRSPTDRSRPSKSLPDDAVSTTGGPADESDRDDTVAAGDHRRDEFLRTVEREAADDSRRPEETEDSTTDEDDLEEEADALLDRFS